MLQREKVFYLGLSWTHQLGDTAPFANPSGMGLGFKEELAAGRWPGAHALPLPQAAGQAETLLPSTPSCALRLAPSVLGSQHAPQCTHPSKEEAPGQHSGVTEAEIW